MENNSTTGSENRFTSVFQARNYFVEDSSAIE